MKKFIRAIAVVAAFGMSSVAASAVTLVTFQEGADGGGTDRFSVSCSLGCQGWLFDAETLGGAVGGLIDFLDENYASGTGEAWEKNLLASVAGDPDLAFSKSPEDPPTSYSSSALYQLFKIGKTPNVGVLVNTAGFAQNYSFSDLGGGSGLSHIADYGTVPAIPLPAAGWLLLAGLGGLAAYGRKKRWA